MISAKKGQIDDREILYILMDYAKNGELFDVIADTGAFNEDLARHYFT